MSENNLFQTIKMDTIVAMKQKAAHKVTLLRMVSNEVNQLTHQTNPVEINDDTVRKVIAKMIKKTKEALAIYQTEQIETHIEKTQQEINWLEHYLPPLLDEKTMDTMIKNSLTETNAQSIKDMGKVIAAMKKKPCDATIDWQQVSRKIKHHLTHLNT